MSKYTPWFDALTQKPVRVGVYRVRCDLYGTFEKWSRWDGHCWASCNPSKRAAEKETCASTVMSDPNCKPQWRGLTKKGGAA